MQSAIRGYEQGPDGRLYKQYAPPAPEIGFIDATALSALTPPTWLIEPYVAEGSLIMLAASANTGKTFMAVDWALTLSSRGHRVLYLALEGLAGLQKRVAAWVDFHQKDPGPIVFGRPGYTVDLLNPQSVAQLEEEIKRRGPFTLIVVDNLGEAAPGDENDAKIVGTAMAALKKLQAAGGGAILDLHNFGHSVDRARGHSRLLDAHDTVVYLKTTEEGIRVSCGKERNAEKFSPRAVALQPHLESCVVVPVEGGVGSEEITQALLRANDPMTVTELAQVTGLERKTVERRIKKLLSLEEIVEAGRRGNAMTYAPGFVEVVA